MKKILLIAVLWSSQGFAAQSISVTVDGQTYMCGGSTPTPVDPCQARVSSFERTLRLCANKVNDMSWCLNTEWSKFKKDSRECVELAYAPCLEVCLSKVNDYSWCSNSCR